MVLWGGLRPDMGRFVLDFATLGVLAVGAWQFHQDPEATALTTFVWMFFACFVMVLMTGESFTNRWPLTFPIIPFFLWQLLLRFVYTIGWLKLTLTFFSFACLGVASLLVLFFPVLALPPTKGPYNVGKCDFYLDRRGEDEKGTEPKHVWVRLLYPTLDRPDHLPYFSPASAYWFCHHMMKFGAPPPLDSCGWMMHTNRLVTRREKHGATLLPQADDDASPFPVVVYSHGLGGHADIYSFQTHALAAQGNIVLVISHSDGSSPAVAQPDGSIVTYDYEVGKLNVKRQDDWEGYKKYVGARRKQIEVRAQEVLTVIEALQSWNKGGVELSGWRVATTLSHLPTLEGRLDMDRLVLMGHSFGGATVLSVAYRFPDLVHTVIAHEYATDWLVPEATASLLHQSRIEGLDNAALFSADLYGDNNKEDRIYGMFNCLLLFSHDWIQNRMYLAPLLYEMNQKGKLGGKNGKTFAYNVVDKMNHEGFSDQPMLTPTWLGRAVGLTGERNPIECAYEVADLTKTFLRETRKSKKMP